MGLKQRLHESSFNQAMYKARDEAEVISNSMFASKKGNFNMLSDTAKSLVTYGIMIAIGVAIVVGVRDTFTVGTTAYNLTNAVVTLFSDLNGWATIVLLVIIGFILMRYLNLFNRA